VEKEIKTRLWWIVAETASGGSLKSGVRMSVLFWCFWQESGFSRREDVFTFNLVYKEMFISSVLSIGFAKTMLQ
jgi:hypothetical protein